MTLLACGTMFVHLPGFVPGDEDDKVAVLHVLFLAHLPLGLLHICLWRREVGPVVASWLLAGVVSFCAMAVAEMAITGRWL